MPVIGYLNFGPPGPSVFVTAFHRGLAETGFVEGQNAAVEYRMAAGRDDQLAALARDLVAAKVDVIAAVGPQAALAAKGATSTIPIVFMGVGDPILVGLVANLARPEGNVTGFSILTVELLPKLVELISELLPQVGVMALLVNPNNPNAQRNIADGQQAARAKGIRLQILKTATDGDIEAAFASLTQLQAGALVVAADPFFSTRRELLVALASRHRVPAIYVFREITAAGGLISYGASITDSFRQSGVYAGKILKGAKPADLPVQQPTKFELVINLKTAKALGVTVPKSLLQRADEVIE